MTEFTRGKLYYLPDGRRCEYLGSSDGKFIVGPVIEFDTYDGRQTERGPIEFASHIYAKAPVEKRAAEIVEIEKQIVSARNALDTVRREALDAAKERVDLLKRLSDVPALRRIADFIEGRITHLVVEKQWSVEVVPLNTFIEYKTDDYRKTTAFKLITLCGESNGNLLWKVADYSDGSGFKAFVRPFTSEVEAREAAIALLPAIYDDLRKHMPNGAHLANYAVTAAAKLGVDPPADLAKIWGEYQERVLADAADKAADAHRVALEKLTAYRAAIDGATTHNPGGAA